MKKKLFTLLTLLCLCVTGAWAGDYVDTYTSLGTRADDPSDYYGSGISKITLGDNATTGSAIKASSNGATSKFTVSTPTGFTIKTITFNYDSKVSSVTCNDNPSTTIVNTATSKQITYTASSSTTSVEFTFVSASGKQGTIRNIAITSTNSSTDDYEKITPTGSVSNGAIPFTSSLGEGKLITSLTSFNSASSGNNDINFGNGRGITITSSRAIKAIYCVWYQRVPATDAGWEGFTPADATSVGSSLGVHSATTNAWTAPNSTTTSVTLKRGEGNTAKMNSIHIFYYPDINYDITWQNGGHGTAPTSPTSGYNFDLPTMTEDGYTHTGWTANKTVKVGDDDVDAGVEIPVGTNVTLKEATTFTGVWKGNSSFVLTSDTEVEVAIGSTSTITYLNNAGTVTFESANSSVATVDADGKITGKAGGKTTITVTDPGSATVAGGSATVTVLVPYANPSAANSYVLDQTTYAFSNKDNTKYYFSNGFTVTPSFAGELQTASLTNSLKWSNVRSYTISVPSNVTVTYAVITVRNNYPNENSNAAANWGTVFGTNYSSEGNLPWSNEDPVEKDFVIDSPSAGGTLTFQPGGNQWQAIINLYTIEYKAKNTVTYDKGAGTGTMAGAEYREGDKFNLPSSTFTAPANYIFNGWLCSVDNNIYDAGYKYTMTNAATTFTAQYRQLGIIRVDVTSASAGTPSGTIGGTCSVDLKKSKEEKGGYKFGGDDSKITLTLAGDNKFRTGDIINVHTTVAGESTLGNLAIFNSDGSAVVLDTETKGVVGDNKFVLPATVNDLAAISVCRTSTYNWNGYVDFIEVTRPNAVVTLNASGYATFSNAEDFEFYGADAYKMALAATATTITLEGTKVTDAIPAGNGILFKGTAGDLVAIVNTTDAPAITGNNLHATTTATENIVDKPAGKTILVLDPAGDTFKVYTGNAFAANKAYFQMDGTNVESRTITMTFDDGSTTAIRGIEEVAPKTTKTRKVVKNGRLVIETANGEFTIDGARVK